MHWDLGSKHTHTVMDVLTCNIYIRFTNLLLEAWREFGGNQNIAVLSKGL